MAMEGSGCAGVAVSEVVARAAYVFLEPIEGAVHGLAHVHHAWSLNMVDGVDDVAALVQREAATSRGVLFSESF